MKSGLPARDSILAVSTLLAIPLAVLAQRHRKRTQCPSPTTLSPTSGRSVQVIMQLYST